ncbi:SurA N-terminal domain-containing protein [Streptomyces sp. TP-A0874]|uniref:SurA N-terminal domain-containing protein n=1 Tax=Streptomyces sp. TP-A0874 TaxID=549819 RepID=UPI0009A063F4|nr:SurA N-terminal domain-containing protein [Streptomyces sp. TP-A0874]
MPRSTGGLPPFATKSRGIGLTAAAVLLASPLLTACGGEGASQSGAAAVVGGERIAVSELQAQVQDIRDAQRASDQSEQLMKGTGQLNRATLHSMIFNRVLEQAAEDAGVTVTRADVEESRELAERGAGGAKRLRQIWLQQYSIAPNQVDQTIRNQVLMEKLTTALGVDGRTQSGQAKVIATVQQTSKKLAIEVNPRYGAWDNEQVQLGNIEQPWVKKDDAEREEA